jgi:hypothetical protein
MKSQYRDVKGNQMLEVPAGDGVKIKIICGKVQGQKVLSGTSWLIKNTLIALFPLEQSSLTRPSLGTKYLHKSSEARLLSVRRRTIFAMRWKGQTTSTSRVMPLYINKSIVLFDDGEQIPASSEDELGRFLLISGKPLGEPVAWYGPIVMNTQKELQIAFEEYRSGRFVKHKSAWSL